MEVEIKVGHYWQNKFTKDVYEIVGLEEGIVKWKALTSSLTYSTEESSFRSLCHYYNP